MKNIKVEGEGNKKHWIVAFFFTLLIVMLLFIVNFNSTGRVIVYEKETFKFYEGKINNVDFLMSEKYMITMPESSILTNKFSFYVKSGEIEVFNEYNYGQTFQFDYESNWFCSGNKKYSLSNWSITPYVKIVCSRKMVY